jgi:hypothetical protein
MKKYIVLTSKNIIRGKQELYKIDFDTLKSIIFNCAFLTKQFNKIISTNKNNTLDSYIVYDEGTNEYLDTNNNIIGFEKVVKKASKKTNEKSSK